MTTRLRRKPTRNLKNLRLKSLSAKKAKQVKGGPINHPDIKRGLTTQS